VPGKRKRSSGVIACKLLQTSRNGWGLGLVAWAALWHWWCQECKPLCFAVSPLEPHPIAAFESFLADTRYNGDNRPRFLYPRSVVERPCSSFLIVVEFQGHDPAAMLVCQSCLVMATCQSTCQPRFQDHAVETIIIRQQFPAETKDEQYTARSYSSCSIGRCSPAVPDRAVVKRSWSTGAPWARIRGHDATMRTSTGQPTNSGQPSPTCSAGSRGVSAIPSIMDSCLRKRADEMMMFNRGRW
jgi:hypothetical protein